MFVCVVALCHRHSLVLEGLELGVEFLVVSLKALDHVVVHGGEGVDQVVTKAWVHVGGEVLPCSRSVLSPVGEVTRQEIGGSWVRTEKKRNVTPRPDTLTG